MICSSVNRFFFTSVSSRLDGLYQLHSGPEIGGQVNSSKGFFQTAIELSKLRDTVAHPKVEKGEITVKYKEGCFPPRYESELDRKVSLPAAKRAKEHLSALADSLHGKAKELHSSCIYETSPFSSILGFEITDA